MYNLVKMRIYIINLSLFFGWKLDSIADLVRDDSPIDCRPNSV